VRLAVILWFATSAGAAFAARRDWTGSAACGSCHPAEFAAWQATPHASTRARFADAKPQARCLACHGTGEAPAGPAIAVEVGCEACHGAGSAYAPDDVMRDRPLARALGLADLSTPALRAQLCASCHSRTTTGRDVDPTAPVHEVRK
jgi:Cytochrome c554 and c-prime